MGYFKKEPYGLIDGIRLKYFRTTKKNERHSFDLRQSGCSLSFDFVLRGRSYRNIRHHSTDVGFWFQFSSDLITGSWAFVQSGTLGSRSGCNNQSFHNEQIQSQVSLSSLRIYLVILNALCLLFTGLLQIPNTPCLYVFRSLQGVVAGMYMNFIPTYISELVPT